MLTLCYDLGLGSEGSGLLWVQARDERASQMTEHALTEMSL